MMSGPLSALPARLVLPALRALPVKMAYPERTVYPDLPVPLARLVPPVLPELSVVPVRMALTVRIASRRGRKVRPAQQVPLVLLDLPAHKDLMASMARMGR